MRLIDAKKPTNRLYVSDFVIEQMQKIPTIEAEPVKHGRWEWLGGDEHVCSVCGSYIYYESHTCRYAYCPNCGAKMDGE